MTLDCKKRADHKAWQSRVISLWTENCHREEHIHVAISRIFLRPESGRFFMPGLTKRGSGCYDISNDSTLGGPMQNKNKAGLTGNQLKLIALISMTLDHVGLQLFPDVVLLRILGRLALPIFAYMIAEGCRHTRSRKKYLGRMVLLAALCQAVYFFAMGSLYQCILVTFSLSIVLIYAIDNAHTTHTALLALLALVSVCAACLGLPRLLQGTDFAIDYGIWGVLLPVLVYFGGSRKMAFLALALCLQARQLGGIQWFSLAAIPLLMCYNGQRGKGNVGKWFYVYYPLHLVVIYGISLLF